MNIINIEHIGKVYGEKIIFANASFGVQQGDKIGIVGINGTGKSTLLKMIAGEETPDEGQIIRQNGLKIAWVPQNPIFPSGADVRSCAFGIGEGEEWQIESNLQELGITQLDQKMEELSGGQKRRVVLAGTLAGDFDVLLLDEPTNHLDAEMISWLEEYLRSYRGTVLMVTHDRYFLDRVTTRIMEISHGKIYGYDADYSGFLELKAAREEMESGKTPVQDQTVELGSVETRMGKKTIELHHVSKSYGDKKILEDFSYIVLRNQRLGIIGPNGCGKSTLLKMIAGLVQPDSGEIEIGETVKIGYFAQEEQHMDDSQRVIDYVKDIAEYITTTDGKISASALLERFLFTPDMQYAPIGKLSGGEKRRLYLLGVLAENANVLLFDEAGNNLDIPTLTILEDYLNSFSGIVIAVSHDRYFLDNVADRIFELDGAGHAIQYEGGYTDYLRAVTERKSGRTEPAGKEEKSSGKKVSSEDVSEEKEVSRKAWKQNQPARLKFSYKEQREFETIDDDIAALEDRLEELDRQLEANATNSVKLRELMEEQTKIQEALDAKMERWVYLNDLAERIGAQYQ